MNKFIFCTLVLAAVAYQAFAEDSWYGKQEASCVRQGGLCIAESQCQELIGARNELCPQQARAGYQCCFGLPKEEKRCRMRGGECFKKGFCKLNKYRGETDCGNDEDCCIFV